MTHEQGRAGVVAGAAQVVGLPGAGRVAVVDGATGFVGANLAASLLRDGRRVVALSRQDAAATRARIAGAVILHGGLVDLDRLQVVGYDLVAPGLGLADDAVAALFDEPCEFWHVAANVNFRAGNRDEVIAVNVGGTERTLEVFRRHAPSGSRYFFVSTAYCCGVDVDQPLERWYEAAPPSAFRNFYEFSKRQAELAVRDAFADGVAGAVLRLGQVVGDSSTGDATTDYGMYNLIRAVWAVARRRPGEHVRIEAHEGANLHLVPIDSAVAWMRAVAEGDLDPTAPPVNVVDRAPVAVARLAEALCRVLPLDVEMVAPSEFDRVPSTQLERVVAARLAYTGSYLDQPFRFGRQTLDRLDPGGVPVMTAEALDRIVGAFVTELMDARPAPAPVHEQAASA